MAHEGLADVLDAVVRVAAQVRDADIVCVVPEHLPQHLETVQVVVGAQLAVVAPAVAQLEGGTVQLLHLLGREADVVVFEEATPGGLTLGAGLAGIECLLSETSIKLCLVKGDGFLRRCFTQGISDTGPGLRI